MPNAGGDVVLTGGADKHAVLFNLAEEKEVSRMTGHKKKITGVELHPGLKVSVHHRPPPPPPTTTTSTTSTTNHQPPTTNHHHHHHHHQPPPDHPLPLTTTITCAQHTDRRKSLLSL
jgi:hypothetical protein